MKNVKIGYAQFFPQFGDVTGNMGTIREMTKEASDADLIVFPELCVCGYDFKSNEELRSFAQSLENGQITEEISGLSKEYNVVIVVGYPELGGDKVYNSSMLICPDGTKSNYRKIHLFSRETAIFEKSDKAPDVVDTPAGRIGMMICFDWVYPETARILALKGAQIVAHPSNLVLQYCQRAMFARSVENGVYTITCNRIGTENRTDRSLTFTGYSQVLDPKGTILVNAPEDKDHIGIVEVDVDKADDKMLTEHNNLLVDRRTDIYGELL